jgi:16S rRNA (guanine966-N2)-methyltransferase
VHCPPGLEVRPTSAKVRQAFFNILGTRIVRGSFLDVFAGSGLMGFEALSRGAARVVFVEEAANQGKAIHKTIDMLAADPDGMGEAQLILGDFRRVLERLKGTKFDLIFADPPYKLRYGSDILALVEKLGLLSEDGLVVIEHFRDEVLPENSAGGNLIKSDYRLYGQTALTFFRSRQSSE